LNRCPDELLQYLEIHVRETLYIETALAHLVPPELLQQCGPREIRREIDHQPGLAWREGGQRHVALAPALVDVVDRAEPDDAGSPHLCRLARDGAEHLRQHVAVVEVAARLLFQEFRDTDLGGFGLVLRHFSTSIPRPLRTG